MPNEIQLVWEKLNLKSFDGEPYHARLIRNGQEYELQLKRRGGDWKKEEYGIDLEFREETVEKVIIQDLAHEVLVLRERVQKMTSKK